MEKNKNFIIALILIVGFIAFWDSFVMKRYAPAKSPVPAPAVAPSSGTLAISAISAPSAAGQSRAPAGTITPAGPTDVDGVVKLTAEGTEVTLLTGGARIGSWQVKEKDHWLELVMPEKHRNFSPLETFPALVFTAERKSDREAVFTAVDPSGLRIVKTLSLLAKPPFHSLSVSVTNTSSQNVALNMPIAWGNGLDKHPVGEPYDKDRTAAEASGLGRAGDTVRRWTAGLIMGRVIDKEDTGPFDWVGVDNPHFLAAFLKPDGSPIPKALVRADRDFPPITGPVIEAQLKPGETVNQEFLMYVGPKSAPLLDAAGHQLTSAIDYGMFGFISSGLLKVLNFYKGLTGNFGWAIILLTLTIQILIFPLTKHSLEHSVKMRELQPHLKKLQEQFKEDPKRYQIEMMNFYKKNGMKFMGLEGCLPVLLQMPIFFAFYAALNNAYDLRGAEWIFWIKDLGVKDPYYVLPIVMGIGMMVQQKMSGTSMDPAQARIMMIMPVMFTFMFFSMPAGLVLYWCVNSLVTIIIQQVLAINRRQHPIVPV